MTTVWLRGSQGRGPCFASTSPWPARQGQQTGQGVRGGVGQGKALGIWLNVWFFSSKGLMTPEAEHRAAEVGESLEGAPCSLHSPLRSPLSLLFSGTSSQPGPNPPDCAGSSSSASIGFPSGGPSYKASHRLADTDRNAPTLVEGSFLTLLCSTFLFPPENPGCPLSCAAKSRQGAPEQRVLTLQTWCEWGSRHPIAKGRV